MSTATKVETHLAGPTPDWKKTMTYVRLWRST